MINNVRKFTLNISAIKEDYIRRYFEHLQAIKSAPSTLRHKYNVIRRFQQWLRRNNMTVKDVQRKHLDKYYLYLKILQLANTSAFQEMANIKILFGFLENIHYIFINPAVYMVLRVPTKRLPYIPSEDDIKKLLAYPRVTLKGGLRDRTFLEVIYATGARIQEMASMSILDLDLDRGTVRIYGKGRKERLVPLTHKAVHWLREYLKRRQELLKYNPDEEALWLTVVGKRLSYQGAEKIVRRNSIGAGLKPFSSHTMRRACATHMLKYNAHPVLIQQLLGHSTMGYLDRYLKVAIPEIKKMHKNSKVGR